MARHYAAVDLGSSSGRVMVGTLEAGKLTLNEMNRFWNGPTEINGTLHWDFVHLFRHIKEGLARAKSLYGKDLVSVGIDTWGVDFGLVDADGKLLGTPVHYRDSRTSGMFEKVFKKVPRTEVFAQTGLQFMELNSLYQLMALSEAGSAQYMAADKLLFSPDLLGYWLTGNQVAERTIASTSQFYNPATRDWAYELLEALGLRTDLFARLVDPGTVLGTYDGLSVVSIGGHDTASAFAAVPVKEGENAAFMSSGTWSLLGTELEQPILTDAALAAGFTNEAGVRNSIRFLKNMTGQWILQELRRVWKTQGHNYDWKAMDELAAAAEPLRYFFDPSDDVFNSPGDMAAVISDFCEKTGQGRPESHGAIIRCYYESLALLYAEIYELLEQVSGKHFDLLRIVGGGCRNSALNQYTANAINRTVLAGPVEATAIGNLITQMLTMGDIQSLEEGRALVRASFADESCAFEPQNAETWQAARQQWRAICRR